MLATQTVYTARHTPEGARWERNGNNVKWTGACWCSENNREVNIVVWLLIWLPTNMVRSYY